MNQQQMIILGIVAIGAYYLWSKQQEEEEAALRAAQLAAQQRAASAGSTPGVAGIVGRMIAGVATGVGDLIDSATGYKDNTGRAGSTGAG